MSKTFKKVLAICLSLAMVLTTAAFSNVTVKAEGELYELNGVAKTGSFPSALNNGTYKLLSDVSAIRLAFGLFANDVTIDLNGHDITLTQATEDFSGIVMGRAGSASSPRKLTITGTGTITAANAASVVGISGAYNEVVIGEDVTLVGDTGVMVGESGTAAKVDMDGTIIADTFGMYVNGNLKNTETPAEITVSGAIDSDAYGIYGAGYAEWDVTGIVIGDSTGIEIRAGELNVSEGAFVVSESPTFSANPNGNGATVVGAGIAISQHTTKLPLDVNITGGEIEGYYAVYEANVQGNPQDAIENVNVAISGGTFVGSQEAVSVDDVEGFVSGGTFSSPVPAEYCATGCEPCYNGDDTYGVLDNRIDISAATISSIATQIYTGEAITPEPTVKVTVDGTTTTLVKDTDYTLSYEDNIDVGTATVTATGIGNYKGTASKTFSIAEAVCEVNGVPKTAFPTTLSNGTIKLLKDVEVTTNLSYQLFATDVTIDLNGHDLSVSGRGTSFSPIVMSRGGSASAPKKLTITGEGSVINTGQLDCLIDISGTYNQVVIGEDVTLVSDTGILVGSSATGAVIDMNGTIDAETFGITVNGNMKTEDPKVVVNVPGTIDSEKFGIYGAGYAEYNITGDITGGMTGIEVRAGELNVSDGAKVKSTSDTFSIAPNGNGTTVVGAGIAISQHTTKLPVNINITGGEIEGYYAVYEANVQGNPQDAIENVNVAISGGTFTGSQEAVSVDDVEGFVSGGTFSSPVPAEYCAEGYVPKENLDNTYGVEVEPENGLVNVTNYKGNRDEDEWLVPTEEGKVFAGWYTDETCRTPYTETTGYAYPKFVDAKVLTAKAQVKVNPAEAKDSLRFITSIDSTNYVDTGFIIGSGDAASAQSVNKVYSSIGGRTPAAYMGTDDSKYLTVFNLTDIPWSAITDDFAVTATPYWVTPDGTMVTGIAKTVTGEAIMSIHNAMSS